MHNDGKVNNFCTIISPVAIDVSPPTCQVLHLCFILNNNISLCDEKRKNVATVSPLSSKTKVRPSSPAAVTIEICSSSSSSNSNNNSNSSSSSNSSSNSRGNNGARKTKGKAKIVSDVVLKQPLVIVQN